MSSQEPLGLINDYGGRAWGQRLVRIDMDLFLPLPLVCNNQPTIYSFVLLSFGVVWSHFTGQNVIYINLAHYQKA